MGWQDAPEVGSRKWSDAPLADAKKPEAPKRAVNPFAARAGIGEAILSMGSSALSTPAAGVAGIVASARGNDAGTDAVNRVLDVLTYKPRTEAGRVATDAASLPFRKLAEGADVVGTEMGASTRPNPRALMVSGSREFAERVSAPNPLASTVANVAVQSAPSLLLSKGVVRPSSVGRAPATRQGAPQAPAVPEAGRQPGLGRVSGKAPSKEQLKADSQAAYKRAEEAGAVLTEESFSGLKNNLTSLLQKEGIDPTLHPKATAALKRIADEKGPVTFEKLETLRRIAKDAEASIEKADARLGGEIVDAIDEYAAAVTHKDLVSGSPVAAAEYKQARNLYSRASKAADLDELVRRAEIIAGANYTVSGLENALRGQFKALALNPKKLRRYTKEEQAAIERVANGGPVENVLRYFGKLAPTGNISAATSAGLGFMVGGAPGAIALPIAGGLSRFAAGKMTARNAALANELVRRGPQARNTRRQTALAEALTE